jgi:hypothetical protein
MPETTKSYCNQCVGERNHVILHTEKQQSTELIEKEFSIDFFV